MEEADFASPIITPMLLASCKRLTQRSWQKKEVPTTLFPEQELTEEMCINFLKQLGCYKITKVVEIQM